VAHVHQRAALFVDLVEDIVAEELDDVPVARLTPSGLVRELGPLIDEAELGEEAHEPAVLELAHELGFEAVDGPEPQRTISTILLRPKAADGKHVPLRLVHFCDDPAGDHVEQVRDRLVRARLAREVQQHGLHVLAVLPPDGVERLADVGDVADVGRAHAEREDEAAEHLQVFLLEERRVEVLVVREHVEDGAGRDPDPAAGAVSVGQRSRRAR
jgi:hypothetical protein